MSQYSFFIEEIPPSINGAYGGKTKRYLTPKVRKFKRKVDQAIFSDPKAYLANKVLGGKRLIFDMYVTKPDWFTKDGRIKKNDITNRIKIFEDAVMESLGLDDSHVWSFRVHKISSTFSTTYCEIQGIDEGHTILLPARLESEISRLKLEAEAQS